MSTQPLPGHDATERMGPDDMATLREEQFTAAALAAARAPRAPEGRPGVCRYCGGITPALAIYCDTDCRADDERERLIRQRQGRGAGHGA